MHGKWDDLLAVMVSNKAGSVASSEVLGRVLNRVAIASGPVARSDISKGTMLIRPTSLATGTVGKAVEALRAQGLLAQEPPQAGQPGAPIYPLHLGNEEGRPSWALVGIHVDLQREGPDKLTGLLCDLNRRQLAGTEIKEEVVARERQMHDLRGMADAICKLTKELQAQLPATTRRELLGVGVELGGHVYRGTVVDSTHAHWTRPVNLADELTERLNVPTVVENDVNALAIHGYYSRIFDEYPRSFDPLNLALVTVFRQGVGGALILNGRIYRGSGGLAPEPGHLTVEYRDSCEAAQHSRGNGLTTFDTECACSTATHQVYGHVDTLATPSRIEGELASRRPGQEKASLADIAKAPKGVINQDNLQVFTEEAIIMQRAGQALGRALADMINILNPGQLVLRLPEALAVPAPQSSGAEYLEAVESAVDTAYSTGPDDARGSRRARHLPIQSYDDDQIAIEGATAAAATALNAFIEHARGRDGHHPPQPKTRHTKA